MNCIRSSILQHLGVRPILKLQNENGFKSIGKLNFTSTASDRGQDQILSRVIELVKQHDTSKATEKADFQKDLSLDSLDKVELLMAIEEEFSIEIPEDKEDKLTCCSDVATYIHTYSLILIPKKLSPEFLSSMFSYCKFRDILRVFASANF